MPSRPRAAMAWSSRSRLHSRGGSGARAKRADSDRGTLITRRLLAGGTAHPLPMVTAKRNGESGGPTTISFTPSFSASVIHRSSPPIRVPFTPTP